LPEHWYQRSRKTGEIFTKKDGFVDISEIKTKHPEHWKKAAAIRILSADAVHAARSGHQGMPIGMADVATVLFEKHLKFDAKAPDWPDRDRFILSAGHGSMLLYSLLHLTGYEDMTMDQIRNFRQWGSITAGHPEYGHAKGVETTTGPLGQGIANSVGFAMAEQSMAARFGKSVVDHHTYVIAGDGCLMEGVSHEAIGLAAKQKLGKLIVFWDDNNVSIDGTLDISDVSDQRARFEAAGWQVISINGHDPDEIDAAIVEAKKSPLPSMIACKTLIALGVDGVEATSGAHGYNIKDKQIAQMREFYDWPYAPYEIPADVKMEWEAIGSRGTSARLAWEASLSGLSAARQAEFERVMSGAPAKRLSAVIRKLKKQVSEDKPKVATRSASQMALEVINPVMTETIGGSADLTGSNNTLTKDLGVFDADNRKGRHVYYGVREHGMAAAMNGMALHGGVRPYGGTFMCFTDYARPAMRLAALMEIPTRPDAPAGRASGDLPRDAKHQRLPPGGRGGNGGSLGIGGHLDQDAVGFVADPSGHTDRAHQAHDEKPDGAGRLCSGRSQRQAPRDSAGDRVRGGNRTESQGHSGSRGHRDAGRIHALLGVVRATERGLSQARAAGRSGPRRHRSRLPHRMGPMAVRRAWQLEESGLRRDGIIRGLGTGGRAVREVRNHG
jgi:transketolase N-terminal domain/subunit